MNGYEIVCLLTGNDVTRNQFSHLTSCDQLKLSQFNSPISFVVLNTARLRSFGEHWVVLGKISKQDFVLFDSSGFMAKQNKFIRKFLKKIQGLGFNIESNTQQIQHGQSLICGHYTVLFIFHMCSNKSFSSFLQLFGRNRLKNDKIALRLFKKHFGSNNPCLNQSCEPFCKKRKN